MLALSIKLLLAMFFMWMKNVYPIWQWRNHPDICGKLLACSGTASDSDKQWKRQLL